MGRSPCCSKEGLNKGAWTSFEDQILTAYITSHGEGNWRSLPNRAGLKRCGKSCRLRWLNYLRPDIKRGNISRDEEDLITRLHKLLGNRWSLIAGRLPGRTDNEIKNYWNTTLGKKAKAQSSSTSKLRPPRVKAATRPQIIQTRATRCTKVVVTDHFPKNHDVHSLSSLEDPQENNSPQEPEDGVLKMDPLEGFQHMSSDLGFLDFGQQDQFRGANDEMEAHDQVLFMDKPFSEDWDANNCLGDHDSASLDLESLAFLLNSSEWP